MGPGIVIPVLLVAVVVPVGLFWAKRRFKDGAGESDDAPAAPAARLTSNALRQLPAPPWRVVYEIHPDKLGGVEHVLIGPPGVFALVTSMEPMPAPSTGPADPHLVARAAIRRGALDDALRRCAMESDRLVTVHWGVETVPVPPSVDTMPGAIAVDGHQLAEWAASAPSHPEARTLTQAQVDLAWQTVVTSIGRPDPLG